MQSCGGAAARYLYCSSLLCVCVQPTSVSWRPGYAGVESVRHQGRYDQSQVEEHPATEDTDDEEDEEHNENSQQQQPDSQ